MDELNEAFLDRLVSKMESQFGNLQEYEKLEYVRRIRGGLNRVLDDSFYKLFKNGYREMGNNYIDRDTLIEIASEYREVVDYIDNEVIGIDTIKKLETKLAGTSFHMFNIGNYDESICTDYKVISIDLQPLRGMGIFQLNISFDSGQLIGFDMLLPSYNSKQKIQEYDTKNCGDEYIMDEMGQAKSVKSKIGDYDRENPLV